MLSSRARVDIDGEGFGFHGSVSARVARAMLLAMAAEQAREGVMESPQTLFPDLDGSDAFVESLAGAERTLYIRVRDERGDAEAYQFVIERRDPETWYFPRLRRMRVSDRPRFAALAAREGRAAALRAMHETLLERVA